MTIAKALSFSLLATLAACAAAPAEPPAEDIAATDAEELDGELKSSWNLLAATVSTPAQDAFPCIDKSDGSCHSDGIPAGTYTVVEKDVAVEAGDMLVLHAQVSAANNLDGNDVGFAAWLRCNGAAVSSTQQKDLSRWFTNDKNGHHVSGNHHAGVWTVGYCYAKTAGTMKVESMGKTLAAGLTFGTEHYSPLYIEQYRKTGAGFSGKSPLLVTAPNTKGQKLMSQGEVKVTDLVLSDMGLARGDVVRETAQISAYYPGDCRNDNMFGTALDHGLNACSENVLCDLPRVTTNMFGLFTVGTPPTTLSSYGFVGDDGVARETYLEDANANLQALVFRSGVQGAALVDARRFRPSASITLSSGTTETLVTNELVLGARSLVDLTAYAEVHSAIPNVSYRATCTAQGVVYQHGTKTVVAQTAPNIRAFSYPYYLHPLSTEAVLDLPAGDYDVATNLVCSGNFGSWLTTIIWGSGLAMHVYGDVQ